MVPSRGELARGAAAAGDGLAAAAREHAGGRLPDYMVPSAVVVLDVLPLTPGGKLDKTVLPAPDHTPVTAGEPEPAALEKNICQAFAEVLSVETAGTEDDFFRLGRTLAAGRLGFWFRCPVAAGGGGR